MFVDICFSNNNEEDFIKIANKLKTDALIFLDKDSLKIKKAYGLTKIKKTQFSNDFKIFKNTIYFFDHGKKNFHSPLKINHVFFKEIKNNSIMALPFYPVLNNKNVFEQLKFIVKLCQKYNVKMCVASFACSPFELRSKADLISFSRLLNIRHPKTCISSLYDFVSL